MKLICKQNCAIPNSTRNGNGLTILTSGLFLFMPKCALCWAAYMNVFSSIGMVIHYQPWFVPVAVILFIITLAKLLIAAILNKNYLAFSLALAGGILMVFERSDPHMNHVKSLALVLMATAVLLDKFIYLVKPRSAAF